MIIHVYLCKHFTVTNATAVVAVTIMSAFCFNQIFSSLAHVLTSRCLGIVGVITVSVRSILRQRPSTDENDTVTCLHTAGLALVNSILIQSIYRHDGRG